MQNLDAAFLYVVLKYGMTYPRLFQLDTQVSYIHTQCLKSPTGFCLLAAKSFYFGVGGGIAAFKKLVQEDGRLTCTTIKVIDDGLSNKREILHLAFSNKEN